MIIKTDILIIGSGAAGLTAAIELSDRFKVAVISKNQIIDSSTWYAQGGIAAVLAKEDSTKSHIEDTLKVGDGLCNREAVEFCIENGREAISWLEDCGVVFTKNKKNSDLHLTQEGGHSFRRVVHADDATGREVSDSLAAKVLRNKNIKILENHLAVDLIIKNKKCFGAYVFNKNKDCLLYTSDAADE